MNGYEFLVLGDYKPITKLAKLKTFKEMDGKHNDITVNCWNHEGLQSVDGRMFAVQEHTSVSLLMITRSQQAQGSRPPSLQLSEGHELYRLMLHSCPDKGDQGLFCAKKTKGACLFSELLKNEFQFNCAWSADCRWWPTFLSSRWFNTVINTVNQVKVKKQINSLRLMCLKKFFL